MAAVNRKVISKFSGYDIFISYRHKEAQLYAMQLHAVLESKGLLVFRDESEEDNLGTNIKQFERIACSSGCLLTIVGYTHYF